MTINITANQNTLLFKEDGSDQHSVKSGKSYPVETVESSGSCLVKVILGYDAGTWLLDPLHWDGLPSTAKRSEIPRPDRHRGSQNKEVIYYGQQDNYRDQDRTCFSSTSAMILKYHLPNSIETDDQYIKRVFQYGDTTDSNVQLKTLKSYGLEAIFTQDWSLEKLIHYVSGKNGNPVGIGWLHRGPKELPGGGHWSLVYGWDHNNNEALVHDPYQSDYDHKNGIYRSTRPGKSQRFSKELLQSRWTVEGGSSGWVLYANDPH